MKCLNVGEQSSVIPFQVDHNFLGRSYRLIEERIFFEIELKPKLEQKNFLIKNRKTDILEVVHYPT